jgi:flagellar motor switch protein FliG
MKSIYDMSGIEKAAALFVAIGPEAAADICKYLDQDSVIKISREIAKIEKLDPEEKEDLIGEFIIQLKKQKRTSQGGEDMAKKVLIDAFGLDKAKDIFNKVNEKHVDEHFEFLKEIDADLIVTLLEQEHAQTIAVVMAYVGAHKAGQVMKLLPRQVARDVALRIAKMEKLLLKQSMKCLRL